MKTKKNKLTNILKFGTLLFGISLILWNCKKDNEINNFYDISITEKLDYTLEKINYEKLLIDKEVQHSLNLLKNKFSNLKQHQNLYSRETSQVANGLTLITDEINKITVNQTISWTFQVETPVLESSDFENFMIKNNNGVFSYFLISYKLSTVENLETDYKEAFLYEISEKYLTLDNLDLASRGAYFMDDDTQGGGEPCEGKVIHICTPCFVPSYGVNGGSTCHNAAIQNDKTLCTGTGGYLYTILDFSGCEQGTYDPASGPTGGSRDENTGNGVDVPTGVGAPNNTSSPTVTSPVTLECDNCSNSLSLISHLNLTEQSQIDWVNDSANLLEVNTLLNFGDTNRWSNDTKTFVKSAIEVLSLNELSPTNNIDTFKNRILKLTSRLKVWGNPEDRIFADYIESLVNDFNKMTVGDVYDIYKLTDKQTKILIWKYAAAIIVPIAETAYPFIVYAVTEATLGAALPLISRIPLAAVIRGAKLNNMVRQLAKLGKAGTSSRIRLIPNGSYEKSLALFNKITKNSVSPVTTTTTANGRIIKVADMGNDNYITFRNFDNSGTANLVANIDLKFPSIWTKTRELKFIK